MRNITPRRSDGGTLFFGLMMIGLGVLFLLDRADIADFGDVIRSYWPMILVLIGVSRLLERRIWAGLWLITLGAWFQMIYFGIFNMTFRSAWPLLLIAIGAGMIVRALYDAARRREPAPPEEHRGAF